MAGTKRRKSKKAGLRMSDFAGDGGPFSEVIVTISIRILDEEITRSRLAVNVYPDPALERMARESLKALRKENYGYNDEGVFGGCLSDNFSGWEDMEGEYPKIDEDSKHPHRQDEAKRMNAYIAESVKWALTLHKLGIEEVRRKEGDDLPVETRGRVN